MEMLPALGKLDLKESANSKNHNTDKRKLQLDLQIILREPDEEPNQNLHKPNYFNPLGNIPHGNPRSAATIDGS
jgi:hypothetical protein